MFSVRQLSSPWFWCLETWMSATEMAARQFGARIGTVELPGFGSSLFFSINLFAQSVFSGFLK